MIKNTRRTVHLLLFMGVIMCHSSMAMQGYHSALAPKLAYEPRFVIVPSDNHLNRFPPLNENGFYVYPTISTNSKMKSEPLFIKTFKHIYDINKEIAKERGMLPLFMADYNMEKVNNSYALSLQILEEKRKKEAIMLAHEKSHQEREAQQRNSIHILLINVEDEAEVKIKHNPNLQPIIKTTIHNSADSDVEKNWTDVPIITFIPHKKRMRPKDQIKTPKKRIRGDSGMEFEFYEDTAVNLEQPFAIPKTMPDFLVK